MTLGTDPRTLRALWTVLVFGLALALVYVLRRVLVLFAFAVVFAYLVFPLVRLVERWRPLARRRAVAIGVVYLVLLGGLGVVGFAAGPRLVTEASLLAQKVPAFSQQLASGTIVSDTLAARGWDVGQVRTAERFVQDHARELTGYVPAIVTEAVKRVTGAWVIVLIPIFAFFMLKDGQAVAVSLAETADTRPGRRRMRAILTDVHRLLGEYVRALILLSLLTFAVWAVLFYLTGVPYPLVLAATGGALEFIPVVGPAIAVVVVLAVALIAGFAHPWLLLGFLLLWRLQQDYVSSPMLMGSGVELHPALIIFGVIAGGEIGGPAAMFLSVPVIAALRIVWRHLQDAPATPEVVTATAGGDDVRHPTAADLPAPPGH